MSCERRKRAFKTEAQNKPTDGMRKRRAKALRFTVHLGLYWAHAQLTLWEFNANRPSRARGP